MASWLKSAEDLLQKVDKTAKAVSTVSKQQLQERLRGDQAGTGSSSRSESPTKAPSAPPRPPSVGAVSRPHSSASLNAKSRAESASSLSDVDAVATAVQEKMAAANKTKLKAASAARAAVTMPKPKPPPTKAESIAAPEPQALSKAVPQKEQNLTKEEKEQQQPSKTTTAAAATLPQEAALAPSTVNVEEQQATLSAAPSVESNLDEATTTGAQQQAGGGDKEKIVRLSRLVQGLKQKVERLQSENTQLEEMIAAADAAQKGGSVEISRLEDALAKEQAARMSLEKSLISALSAKEAEAMSLRQQLDAATVKLSQLAENLAAKEAESAVADAERSVSESQLISTLRKEIESAEAALEEERKALAAARRASAAREQELDASLTEAAASLAAMQQTVEKRTAKSALTEERCTELEREIEILHQQIATAEAKVENSANNDSSTSAASQRVEELESTLAEVRRAQMDAESDAATANQEAARLRAEVETLKRQLTEARSTDSADLRRRLQEATDALYTKQAQLERATADRAAIQLQLERQTSALSADSIKRRTAAVDRLLGGADDGYGIVPMDSLGDAYTRLANAPGHLGQAVQTGAKFLDSTASQAVRVLRHYPLGRLGMFCYLIGMHLFIYLLLHRLQHRAFAAAYHVEDAEAAAAHLGGGAVGNNKYSV